MDANSSKSPICPFPPPPPSITIIIGIPFFFLSLRPQTYILQEFLTNLVSLKKTSLSYHATLESHHPIDHHTYPSQHISHPTNAVLEPMAPVLSSPSFSQDREQEEDARPVPAISSYQLSHSTLSHIPPTPPSHTSSNPFKRPYQPDPTPVSSPGHQNAQPPNAKRRKSTSKEAWIMTEDDNLLLKLKDEEGLPWKAIAQKFRDMNRGEFRVPTLQMRYKRLKEKMRIWAVEDVGFLNVFTG